MNDERESVLLLCAELTFDVRALRVALLDHDAAEARFLTARIGGLAQADGQENIAILAASLGQRLEPDGHGVSVGKAYDLLSNAVGNLLSEPLL